MAAVACSTPTHAAEAAVPLDCGAARRSLAAAAGRLERQSRRAIVERARTLARLSRAPAAHIERHRTRLHQHLRELRASARRGVAGGERFVSAQSSALARKAQAAELVRVRGAARAHADGAALDRGATAALARRRRDLDRFAAALAAHDPQRTLERGYALVEDGAGEPVVSASAARGAPSLILRLHDGRVPVRPEPPVA